MRRAAPVAAVVVALLAVGCGGAGEDEPLRRRSGAGSDEIVRPAFAIPRPTGQGSARDESRWAAIRRTADAHAAPSASARVLARVPARTPEGTTNIVLVRGRRTDARGRLWVRVRLAVLPNGTTGWLPRTALGAYGVVRTRLVIDRRRLRATLLRGGRPVFSAPIAVGAPQWPTPPGEFYVRNRLTRYRSPMYGPLAFGTSARSPTLTDWPGGGFVGIHGTDRPDLIPGRVSHGCIRLRNPEIRRLDRLMPVGTPITVR